MKTSSTAKIVYNFGINCTLLLPFKVPGEINITAELIGGENRTLSMVFQDSNDFNLVIFGVDILVFSNKTFINVSWYQSIDMDIVDDYIFSADVSNTFP